MCCALGPLFSGPVAAFASLFWLQSEGFATRNDLHASCDCSCTRENRSKYVPARGRMECINASYTRLSRKLSSNCSQRSSSVTSCGSIDLTSRWDPAAEARQNSLEQSPEDRKYKPTGSVQGEQRARAAKATRTSFDGRTPSPLDKHHPCNKKAGYQPLLTHLHDTGQSNAAPSKCDSTADSPEAQPSPLELISLPLHLPEEPPPLPPPAPLLFALERHAQTLEYYQSLAKDAEVPHRRLMDAYNELCKTHKFASSEHAKASVAYGVAKKRHIEMMAEYGFAKVQYVASVVDYEAELRTMEVAHENRMKSYKNDLKAWKEKYDQPRDTSPQRETGNDSVWSASTQGYVGSSKMEGYTVANASRDAERWSKPNKRWPDPPSPRPTLTPELPPPPPPRPRPPEPVVPPPPPVPLLPPPAAPMPLPPKPATLPPPPKPKPKSKLAEAPLPPPASWFQVCCACASVLLVVMATAIFVYVDSIEPPPPPPSSHSPPPATAPASSISFASPLSVTTSPAMPPPSPPPPLPPPRRGHLHRHLTDAATA